MENKTIGIVCTSKGFGGLEMNTLALARELSARGWEVRLLVNSDSQMYKEALALLPDVRAIQQLSKNTPKATGAIISRWLKGKKVSILFTPYNKDIAPLASYKRFRDRKIRLVYQQHMKVGVNKKDIIHSLRYRKLDLWISPLDYLKQETLDRTHVSPEKIVVIPFGLEVEKFQGMGLGKDAAREELELPADSFLIGVLGRIDPKKGQDFLIRALPQLHARVERNIHLLIMGNITPHEGDDYLKGLYRLTEEQGLKPYVHFKGYNPDVMLFYKAINVFAMPAHGETFGMVTIEAMAAGVPVIGVGRDGTKEILLDGKLGYLHRLENMDEFIDGIRLIVEGVGLKEKVDMARGEVADKYPADKMFSEIDVALSALL